MKSKSGMYHPSGDLQGDDKGMPDRGTKTGMNGDTYGASLDVDATNTIGKMTGTDSDPIDGLPQCNDND